MVQHFQPRNWRRERSSLRLFTLQASRLRKWIGKCDYELLRLALIPLIILISRLRLCLDKKYPIVHSTHYREFTETVLQRHLNLITEDASNSIALSLIFDGTTYAGEILAILIRFWGKRGEVLTKVCFSHYFILSCLL